MLFSSTDTYQDPDPYLDVFQIRIPSRRPLNTDPEFTYGSNSTVFAVDEGGGREGCAWCDTIELHASYDPLLFRLMAEKDKLEMKLNIQGEKKDD